MLKYEILYRRDKNCGRMEVGAAKMHSLYAPDRRRAKEDILSILWDAGAQRAFFGMDKN